MNQYLLHCNQRYSVLSLNIFICYCPDNYIAALFRGHISFIIGVDNKNREVSISETPFIEVELLYPTLTSISRTGRRDKAQLLMF